MNILQELKARRVAKKLVSMVKEGRRPHSTFPTVITEVEKIAAFELTKSVLQLRQLDEKANEELQKAKDERHNKT